MFHLQEVVGSAIALSLLTGGRLPLWAGVLITAVVSFGLLFIERFGVRCVWLQNQKRQSSHLDCCSFSGLGRGTCGSKTKHAVLME